MEWIIRKFWSMMAKMIQVLIEWFARLVFVCTSILYSLEPRLIVGFKIKEQDNTSNAKMFRNLQELVEHYQFCLKIPFSSSITKEIWFLGDINSEETAELLNGQEPGTFCIRFSSTGSLAASFVMEGGDLQHTLLGYDSNSIWLIDPVKYYNNLEEFVADHSHALYVPLDLYQ